VTLNTRLDYTTLGLKVVPWLLDCTGFVPTVHHLEVAAVPGNKKVRAADPDVRSSPVRCSQGLTHVGRAWQVVTTGGLDKYDFLVQNVGGCLVAVAQQAEALATQLPGGGVAVDLRELQEIATGAAVDTHTRVRIKEIGASFDQTFALPLSLGLACTALKREMRPGVALLGTAPLGFPGCPVAPVVGPVLSDGATEVCLEHGVHTVIGGERVRGDAQAGTVKAGGGGVKYTGTGSLLEALQAATVPGR
jgi:hypothetical protein